MKKRITFEVILVFVAIAWVLSGCQAEEAAVPANQTETPSGTAAKGRTDKLPETLEAGKGEEQKQNPAEGNGKQEAEKNTGSSKRPAVSIIDVPKSMERSLAAFGVGKDSLEELWSQMYDIAPVAQDFYVNNFTKTRLISKNGLLYNKAAETAVDLAYLLEEGLDEEYKDTKVNVLLMNGSDLAEYDELSVRGDDELSVFLSAKHPTQDQYLIVSANSKGGILPGDKYRELLALYSQEHGQVRRVSKRAEEYNRILDFIRMYESRYEDYFVRSMMVDDKYASVVLSLTQSTADVKQYILQKENNVWKVVMDGIEGEPRPVVAVNQSLPDFNSDMLSPASIYDYRNSMKREFSDVIQVLLDEGLLGSVADILYVCGTNDYAYLATESQLHFLLIQKDGSWTAEKVSGEYEAEKIMTAADKFAPVFILLDD